MNKRGVTKQLHPKPGEARKISAAGGTREPLLGVAVTLFAEKGFDGVAVDEIVAAAGVNKRMVYHYFGSKEGLYRATLERVFEELGQLEEGLFALKSRPSNPEQALRNIVRTYFRFLLDHPQFVRLLLWENLQHGTHISQVTMAVRKTPMLEHLESVLQRGIRDGLFRPRLDTRLVLVSLIGLCLIYFSNRHTLSWTVGIDLSSTRALDRAVRHTADLLVAGLKNQNQFPARA